MMYCLFENRRERTFLELILKHQEASSAHPEPSSFKENKALRSLSSWQIINDGREEIQQRARTKRALSKREVTQPQPCSWR